MRTAATRRSVRSPQNAGGRFRCGWVAIGLATACAAAAASDDCLVAGVLVRGWIAMARSHAPALPVTAAVRRDLEFTTTDGIVLKGFSYAPAARNDEPAASDFVLLLQGSASSAAQLAETASALALAAKREVFVYDYRGYGRESTASPTAASILQDIEAILDRLSAAGGRGVVIGLSMGGLFAVQALKHPKRAELRALLDSVPARVPTIPFLLDCPRRMNPLDAATPEVAARLGVLYARGDAWSQEPAAAELVEKVKAGGGRAWLVEGPHVDLSPGGLAARLPIYVDFVRERTP